MIEARTTSASRGRILYDASRVVKPHDDLFNLEGGCSHGGIEKLSGGRGAVAILRHGEQRWVLRHYRRGGMAAKFSKDRYWWYGEARTRSFAEWRLLASLHQLKLPVPAPVAARYVRHGCTYTADLITELLPNSTTLAAALLQASIGPDVWRGIGRTIAAFHGAGVHHADLNAHNILLSRHADPLVASASSLQLDAKGAPEWHGAHGSAGFVHLLDFDRGRIRARGAWEEQVLARLRRSLEKVGREAPVDAFGETQWQWMMEGYEAGGRRTADGGR